MGESSGGGDEAFVVGATPRNGDCGAIGVFSEVVVDADLADGSPNFVLLGGLRILPST